MDYRVMSLTPNAAGIYKSPKGWRVVQVVQPEFQQENAFLRPSAMWCWLERSSEQVNQIDINELRGKQDDVA